MAALVAAVLSVVALPGLASAYPPEPSDEEIAAKAVTVICDDEVPYISYEIDTTGFDPAEVATLTATLTLIDRNGDVAEGPLSGQPLSGQLLYPGAKVDSAGNGTDWPGWMQNADGMWVPDPSDAHLRSGLRLNAVVNPEVTTAVQYPPESAACLSPPGSSTATSPQGASRAEQLPSTGGSDPSGLIWIAAVTLLAGAAIWGVSFRRNRPAEPTA